MTTQTYRKLYRSRENRMAAGVLGGLAEYANADPTLVRVGFVLLAFLTGGTSLIAYPIMWVIVPEADATAPTPPTVA
jgi:phage shock protein C